MFPHCCSVRCPADPLLRCRQPVVPGKCSDFLLWFPFYSGREWIIQSADTPEETSCLMSMGFDRFLNLYTETQKYEAIDTVWHCCRLKKKLIHLWVGVIFAVSVNILMLFFSPTMATFYKNGNGSFYAQKCPHNLYFNRKKIRLFKHLSIK